jgi:hypothetical protein
MARCAITWLRSKNSWRATKKFIGRGMAGQSRSRDVLSARSSSIAARETAILSRIEA